MSRCDKWANQIGEFDEIDRLDPRAFSDKRAYRDSLNYGAILYTKGDANSTCLLEKLKVRFSSHLHLFSHPDLLWSFSFLFCFQLQSVDCILLGAMATPDEPDKKAGYALGTEVDVSSSFDTINALVAEGSFNHLCLPPMSSTDTHRSI